jgi:hypothetical protein
VLVAAPPGVVILITPVFAVVGTKTVADVAVTAEGTAVAPPVKVTSVAPVRFVPVITTLVPLGPVVGVKEVMVGAGIKVKLDVLVAVPPGVLISMAPVSAPVGTTTVADVAVIDEGTAVAPPVNVTNVAPVRFVPLITTFVPLGPVVGVKDLIVGVDAIISGTWTELVKLPLLPVIVIVYEPCAADAPTVNFAAVDMLDDNGAKETVTPDGTPEALNTTFPPNPLAGFIKTDTVGSVEGAV